ncbi:MAG: polysaccharide deacetylase family protein [Bacteroidales bacterium]|jgi:hypothetical protein|nr:polysaccharide deacetylase family protein [Bacteroidales bacterium]
MKELYDYLLRFLLNCPDREGEILPHIAYSANEEEFEHYAVVIVQSDFFTKNYGTVQSLPTLPLQEIEAMPFLYGETRIEMRNSTCIIHADLLASAFVLLSGYEMWVQANVRDVHGRFAAKDAIAYKGNFLHRPIVDEYGAFLRTCLREAGIAVNEPEQTLTKLYLTHDIDHAFQYRSLRGFFGAWWRTVRGERNEIFAAFRSYCGRVTADPLCTLPFIFEKNNDLKQHTSVPVESVVFFKSPVQTAAHDKPLYRLHSRDMQFLFRECRTDGAKIGLHTSYRAGAEPELIAQEKAKLEQATRQKIIYNRHHFLRITRIEDLQTLADCGICDDFTLGFADCAGFRLGTCRAVQWINPLSRSVSPLRLHPLTAMEESLTTARYMHLSENEAFDYLCMLIENARKYGGEISLLWHNTSFAEGGECNHKMLYSNVLNYLKNK